MAPGCRCAEVLARLGSAGQGIGTHVFVGVLMLMSLFSLSLKGKLPQEKSQTVELVGLYWHFVDIIWILIFTLIYLIPT